MISLRQFGSAASHERGFTLIEVLVTVVILAIGLLGLAGMQLGGLRYSFSSYQRSQATILASDIVDRMRANPTVARNGSYNIALGTMPAASSCTGTASNCTPAALAGADLYEWKQMLATVLPSGNGTITNNGNTFTITIQWDDTRGVEPAKSLAIETVI